MLPVTTEEDAKTVDVAVGVMAVDWFTVPFKCVENTVEFITDVEERIGVDSILLIDPEIIDNDDDNDGVADGLKE